ncbi:hypothetical protein AB0N17_15540 [Streptomyces sp. NPDC051133]|uniref:hypothetical protein n=1 Tax=Streptomyces sp. NPDC051133 TaxID=3155521 RepID=UPI00342A5CC3
MAATSASLSVLGTAPAQADGNVYRAYNALTSPTAETEFAPRTARSSPPSTC